MKEYIKLLFDKLCCTHNWEEIQKTYVYAFEGDKLPIYTKILYKCSKCGKFKKIKF